MNDRLCDPLCIGKGRLHIVYYRERLLPPSEDFGASCLYGETWKVAFDVETGCLDEIRKMLGPRLGKLLRRAHIEPLLVYDRLFASDPATITFAFDRLVDNGSAVVEFKFWLNPAALAQVSVADTFIRFHLKAIPTTQPRFCTPRHVCGVAQVLTHYMTGGPQAAGPFDRCSSIVRDISD